eukprot:Nk52_evm36s2309 gene=Nk52_evmTU36s2309
MGKVSETIESHASSLNELSAESLTGGYSDKEKEKNIEARIKICAEIKEQMESFCNAEYGVMLEKILPEFLKILKEEEPVFLQHSNMQKLRYLVLECLNRLPNNEILRPYAPKILEVIIHLLEVDNEENANICLRIFMDAQKSFRSSLEQYAKPFIRVVKLYFEEMMSYSVTEESLIGISDNVESPSLSQKSPLMENSTSGFDSPSNPSNIAPSGSNTPRDSRRTKLIPRAVSSFKVLTECPMIVVVLLQFYPTLSAESMGMFVPLCVEVLSLDNSKFENRIESFIDRGGSQDTEPSNGKQSFSDFIGCHVKILAFLAYMLRSSDQKFPQYQSKVPKLVIKLLKHCPCELAVIRKELLVAMRHILQTDFRNSFVAEFDTLMDEDLIFGTGRTALEILRPVACSALADFVHYVRDKLSLTQIASTVRVYCRVLHDSSLPVGIQTMSAKLLINLVECIASNPQLGGDEGRKVLITIFDALVIKCGTLKDIIKWMTEYDEKNEECGREVKGFKHILNCHHPMSIERIKAEREKIKDYRVFVKNFSLNLKAMAYGISSCNPPNQTKTFNSWESFLVPTLLRNALECFKIYLADKKNSSSVVRKEEKEVLDSFASFFTLIDPQTAQEVLQNNIEFLFNSIVDNPAVFTVPQHFLANPGISKSFAEILLQFLLERMEMLGSKNAASSGIILRLFKLIFGSVTLFSDKNEVVLQPHMSGIITKCVTLSLNAEDPHNYFLLLRALFRSIAGGKFEQLYNEFLPQLNMLLKRLNRLLNSTNGLNLIHLFIELCLTVPVRLSALLPHLHCITRPLVCSLRASKDLIGQGLRTLELCIDNLTPEYLDPIISPVRQDLLENMWYRLRNDPHNCEHSQTILRILGKLGGRYRLIHKESFNLNPQLTDKNLFKITLDVPYGMEEENGRCKHSSDISFYLDRALQSACNVLNSEAQESEHLKAFATVKYLLCCVLGGVKKEESEGIPVALSEADATIENLFYGRETLQAFCAKLSTESLNYLKEQLVLMIRALLKCLSYEYIKTDAQELIEYTQSYFGLIILETEFDRTFVEDIENPIFQHVSGRLENNVGVHPVAKGSAVSDIYMSILLVCICSDDEETNVRGQKLLEDFYGVIRNLVGKENGPYLVCFSVFLDKLSLEAREKPYSKRNGTVNCVAHILEIFIEEWVVENEVQLAKILLFIIKDIMFDISFNLLSRAKDAFKKMMKICCANSETKKDFKEIWKSFKSEKDKRLKEKKASKKTENKHEGEDESNDKVAEELTEDEICSIWDGVRNSKLKSLVELLVSHLASPSEDVRHLVQEALSDIAEVTDCGLSNVIMMSGKVISFYVIPKSFRSVSLSYQVGHLHALSYVLQSGIQLLSYKEQLLRIVRETLAFCEADDAILAKQAPYKNATSFDEFRAAGLTFLKTVSSSADFDSRFPPETREKAIKLYFKYLPHKSDIIVEASKQALDLVVAEQKLPKNLVHMYLRPLIANLSDRRNLTTPSLKGLERVIKLLTHCFNAAMGDKLLEILKGMIEAGTPLAKADFEVACGVLNIFHVLPEAAEAFLEPLLEVVLQLEKLNGLQLDNPFRQAFARFANRFPKEYVGYSINKIENTEQFFIFLDILEKDTSACLVDALVEDSSLVRGLIADENAFENGTMCFFASKIILIVLQKDNMFLKNNPKVLESLVGMWNSSGRIDRLKNESQQEYPFVRESEIILKCFMVHLKTCRTDTRLIFGLLSVLESKSILDYRFLKNFLVTEIAFGSTVKEKRKLIKAFFEFYSDRDIEESGKADVLRLLITPIAYNVLKSGDEDLFDDDLISTFVKTIIENPLPISSDSTKAARDELVIELLNLTTVLLSNMPQKFVEHKKQLVKFPWNHFKDSDIVVRYSAYVLVCRFIEAYETPQKLILQVYNALLRAYQPEARPLVKEAFEILLPVLPKRLPSKERYPMWIKWTKKIINDEGYFLAQLIHIWHLVVRHESVFYPYRSQFVMNITNSLARIGLNNNALFENRKLAVELSDVIVKWEEKRVSDKGKEREEEAQKMEKDMDTPKHKGKRGERMNLRSSEKDKMPKEQEEEEGPSKRIKLSNDADENYSPGMLAVQLNLNFLIRMSCHYGSTVPGGQELSTRCIAIIERMVSEKMWPNLCVKYNAFEKYILSVRSADNTTGVVSALQIMTILMKSQKPEEKLKFLPTLKPSLNHCLGFFDVKVVDQFSFLLLGILEFKNKEIVPKVEEGEDPMDIDGNDEMKRKSLFDDLFFKISEIVAEGLASDRSRGNVGIYCAIKYLLTMAGRYDTFLEPFLPQVMRTFQKLTKEILSPSFNNAMPSSPESVPKLIIMIIDLCVSIFQMLSEHRRTFLNGMSLLLEKCLSVEVLSHITKLMEGWVLNDSEKVPNMKEKSSLLTKMTSLKNRLPMESELWKQFITLTLSIYKSNSPLGTTCLEPAKVAGLKWHEPELRKEFFALYVMDIPKSATERLKHIFSAQNWEYLGSDYWIKQCMELILEVYEKKVYLCSALENASLPSVQLGSDGIDATELEGGDKFEDSFISLADKYEKQREKYIGSVTSLELVEAVRYLCQIDDGLSEVLWIQIFPQIWKQFSKEEQKELRNALVVFLSRDYHSNQVDNPYNTIRSMLSGFIHCDPPIHLPPYLMKYLAKTHGAWHNAMWALQKELDDFDRERGAFSYTTALSETDNYISVDSAVTDADIISKSKVLKEKEETIACLNDLMEELCEEDFRYGLWRKHCTFSETVDALCAQQHGYWFRAQKLYEAAMKRVKSGPYVKADMYIWEREWIECAKRLGEWDLVKNFAILEGRDELTLQSAWRVNDWGGMNQALQNVEIVFGETAQMKIWRLYVDLCHPEQNEFSNAEKLIRDGTQLALRQWSSLPSIVGASHLPILQMLQQFVELNESYQILCALKEPSSERIQCIPELKAILGLWRERLPNKWEDIVLWDEVITWRHKIFSAINRVFQPLANEHMMTNNTLAYMGFHEMAWSVNRFAHIARKHNLLDVCLLSLNKIYSLPNIEVQDAFLKLKEQAKCYFKCNKDLKTGLDIINSTNLSYFVPKQKAEFFALQGCFLEKMGKVDEAYKSFSAAITVYDDLNKGWYAWGAYCDRIFISKKVMSWGSHAITCYMNACRFFKEEKARKILSRVLWLLSYDDESIALGEAFEKSLGFVSKVRFVIWIPQLLSSLSRPEAQNFAGLLKSLAKSHPQALYCSLRATFLEQRSVLQSSPSGGPRSSSEPASPASKVSITSDGKSTPSSASVAPRRTSTNGSVSAHQHCQNIMYLLRSSHQMTTHSIESIVEEITGRFKPNQTEEMLRTIQILLSDCLQRAFTSVNNLEDVQQICVSNQVENHLKKILLTLKDTNGPSGLALFRDAIRSDFEKYGLSNGKWKLTDAIDCMTAWKSTLEKEVAKMPKTSYLQHISRYLSDFAEEDIDIPGEYLDRRDNLSSSYVKISRFLSKVEVGYSHGSSFRRIYIEGNDGKVYPFAVQHAPNRYGRAAERIFQLFQFLNDALSKRKETRKRQIFFNTPVTVPFSPNIRLISDHSSYVSLEQIFEKHCLLGSGIDPFEPVLKFYRTLCAPDSKFSSRAELKEVRKTCYEEIRNTMVPENLLTKFMVASFPDFAGLWMFRKHIISQMAAISFASYVLCLGHRLPHTLSFCLENGNFLSSELYPMLNSAGLLESSERVPFRLTPVLCHFMTRFGVEGSFLSSFLAVARSLAEPDMHVQDFLNIIFKYEVVSWHASHSPLQLQSSIENSQMIDKVIENTDNIVGRIEGLSMEVEPGVADAEPSPSETASTLTDAKVKVQGDKPRVGGRMDKEVGIVTVKKASALIAEAMNPDNLALMDPTWQAWL